MPSGVSLYDELDAAPPSKLLMHHHLCRKRMIGKLVAKRGALYYVTYRDRSSTLYRKYNSYGITQQVLDILFDLKLKLEKEVYVAILEKNERKVYLSKLWDWLNSGLKVTWNNERQVHLPVSEMLVRG